MLSLLPSESKSKNLQICSVLRQLERLLKIHSFGSDKRGVLVFILITIYSRVWSLMCTMICSSLVTGPVQQLKYELIMCLCRLGPYIDCYLLSNSLELNIFEFISCPTSCRALGFASFPAASYPSQSACA